MSQPTRIGIVTSKREEVARRTLAVCGLGTHVETLVCADHVTRGKPDPEAVRLTLAALDLTESADETLFVGDSPFDLRAGRAAGTRTAAVCWGACPRVMLDSESPDYVLERFEDLLELVPSRSPAESTIL